jgi:hypothetical protein
LQHAVTQAKANLQNFRHKADADNGRGQAVELTPAYIKLESQLRQAEDALKHHQSTEIQGHNPYGGIDLNSANLKLIIKRDGRGMVLPLTQQDLAQFSRVQGFIPEIVRIKPVLSLPIIGEIQQKLSAAMP